MKFLNIGLLLLFVSCSNIESLEAPLNKESIDWKNKDHVIFLPYRGCSVCLNKALGFLKKNESNKNIQFVFINYESKKEIGIRLRVKYQINDLSPFKFIEDPSDFYENGVSNFYPSIISINSSRIESLTIADPKSLNIWEDLP
ncbi:MAG: hypothetical protein Roseis2KO_46780 [Roseivirga sp.]